MLCKYLNLLMTDPSALPSEPHDASTILLKSFSHLKLTTHIYN